MGESCDLGLGFRVSGLGLKASGLGLSPWTFRVWESFGDVLLFGVKVLLAWTLNRTP